MTQPNNRRPVYNKDRTMRVVSAPGGQWQAQRHDGGNGTRTFDPWHSVGKPCDWNRACAAASVKEG